MWDTCNNNWHYFGMHRFWWLFWVFVLIVIFLVLKPYLKVKNGKDSALEILSRKYASGEISKEEFVERKKILEDE